MSFNEESEYRVTYTIRDVLLYAVAVGFGSNNNHDTDLSFVWEDHDDVRVVPTWVCCLPFWATATHRSRNFDDDDDTAGSSLPNFPPPTMKSLLPQRCLRDDVAGSVDVKISDYPILHTRQCFQWKVQPHKQQQHQTHEQTKPPIKTQGSYRLRQRCVQVIPKAIGTFVTTQTQIIDDGDDGDEDDNVNGTVVCTMQSTALILGLDDTRVRPFNDASVPVPHIPEPYPSREYSTNRRPPDHAERIHITPRTTLLYRLASGDTNAIHVNPMANPWGDGTRCVLHGLAALGMVSRIVEQRYNTRSRDGHGPNRFHRRKQMQHMEANFTHPVMVGDTIEIQFWDVVPHTNDTNDNHINEDNANKAVTDMSQIILYFRVIILSTQKVAIDKGVAILTTTIAETSSTNIATARSKL